MLCLLFCVIWQASEFCNQFYRSYFLTIEQEIFAVLTDTFHKPGFKLHVLVLQHLFCLVCALLLSFPSLRHDQLWLMRMPPFRSRVVLWQSLCGMLQQSLIHTQIMLCLFVSIPLNFWVHHSQTWLHQRWDHLFIFFSVTLLWSLFQSHLLDITNMKTLSGHSIC